MRLQRCNSMAKRHPQRTFQAENLAWATLGLRVAVYIDAGRSLCHGRGGPTRCREVTPVRSQLETGLSTLWCSLPSDDSLRLAIVPRASPGRDP